MLVVSISLCCISTFSAHGTFYFSFKVYSIRFEVSCFVSFLFRICIVQILLYLLFYILRGDEIEVEVELADFRMHGDESSDKKKKQQNY